MRIKPKINTILLLFFLSGFCNLIYEIVWSRMLNLVFGVTVFSISTVLVSFMLGLALGGIIFGRVADRLQNAMPTFSFVHVGISVSTIILVFAFPGFMDFYHAVNTVLNPGFYSLRIALFFLCLLFLIVPTTLMGATFPLVGKIAVTSKETAGKEIGVLYAVNTLGSVIGCMGTVFFFLRFAGMKGTMIGAAGIDLIIGVVAFVNINASKPEDARL